MIRERSFNQESYIEFLQQLRDQYPDQKLVLFLDNLSVHKTRAVKEQYEELELGTIFNAPYSPQYNGIESYFFLVKQEYKKELLQRVIKKQELNVVQLIESAVSKVEDQKAMNCVKGGLKEIINAE